MIEKAFNLSAEIWQWIWLFLVSFTGGVVGFITKISPTLKGRSSLHGYDKQHVYSIYQL